ncbi:adenylate/guanylate cyclase domain-containing protein [Mesorhizobium sp.]|uniref:adenylate/guanylate cyclase domain-containing protein n=1 Tax=Mesorhizobium sp. TaxID=1871066 RepID=UPI000FE4C860|nr:adenylate/guanylate cyclase domain-containing protein [Mesorhizobium sp.]RWK44302.1 MAG: adenylate/guanylate cyclase domain-containing protein [Mesorhizobium sp.]RWK66259.1 MAG: adenylate/guanylate cyclase domain-containing protein [Mesorhizobium sp.]RWK74148.1 MAG: adenylate/guanylate cyclase domain-containing protein [Mesorhizobium sp.]RWK74845.1 MAG: adenylate/guanylate cyclase domain-containing protein [Mesorhizobium sp.]RWK98933.1 MAG: adenylate/guanylate cyclase domain-containing prot
MDIAAWLGKLGLEEYASAFRDNDIDAQLLLKLNAEDLKELGVASIGHRRKLIDAIADLQDQDARSRSNLSGGRRRPAPTAASPEAGAERRQLTVMFCDLVGSTALASRLDVEDLREVIGAYQQCVSDTINRFGGFVAKYMGDGVLVYFGYPQAHEDDAERAVRAGLALIDIVSDLEPSDPLQARIGIGTGIVVVGDIVGYGEARERGVIGETPNLAARLQGLAEPNTVVIEERTHHLLGHLFDFRDLGTLDVKGYSEPIRAYQVLRPSVLDSRFEALRGERFTPLVGREKEIEALRRCWQCAKAMEGQVVLLSGEPGIGKSRITVAVLEEIANEKQTHLCYFCSPHHGGSALYPVIRQLERAAEMSRDDDASAKLDKLEALLSATSTAAEDCSLLADLLSLPNFGRFPTLDLSSQQRKSRTLQALVRQLEALARREPVLMIFEDLHWIDPTSLELLDRIIERIRQVPVLLIVTFRPEFSPPWTGRPHVSTITLSRLGQRDGARLVEQVLGKQDLPAEAIREIVERTDGVPLYLEEFTKAVAETCAEGNRALTTASAAGLGIPATLHASLMARLDRLGAAKSVAQIGAVIGREFSHDLLAAVAPYAATELQAFIDQLTSSGLVFRRGTTTEALYLFKHALVQDAAYNTLLRHPRQQLHANIARTLEERFAGRAAREPEVLAHHFAEAGQTARAIDYWLMAGKQAAQRSANLEAIDHFSKGLKALESLPPGSDKDRKELALQTAIGTALISVHGYAAQETGAAYGRARALCQQFGDAATLHATLSGEFVYHFVRGDYAMMRQLTKEARLTAERTGDDAFQLAGHRMGGISAMYFGSFVEAEREFETILRLYDPDRHRPPPVLYVHDPKISALAYLAIVKWILGQPDKARTLAIEALRYAEELNQANLTAHVRTYAGAGLDELLGETSRVRRHADVIVALADQHSLHYWRLNGLFLQGWAIAQDGSVEEGLALMRENLTGRSALGVSWYHVRYLCMLATTLQKSGAAEAGLAVVAEAKDQAACHYEHMWDAEVERIEAEMLELCARSALECEARFRSALTTARCQSAKSFELRAAVGLAKLWARQGRGDEARDLLGPLYESFTEGFNTRDLTQTRRLLDKLH